MKTSSVWITFAVAAFAVAVEGYYYTSLEPELPLAAFDQQEDYLFGDPYYPLETGLYQSHPFESSYEQSPTFWDLFQPPKPQFMNYEAQPDSLIHYIPVNPGSWITPKPQFMNYEAQPDSLINYIPVKPGSSITPNVYVKGRGYTTDRYIAPTMLEKYLAMNPR